MLPKILITGVAGVGKTTIAAHSLLHDKGFKHFAIGENMIEIGKDLGILNKPEDINSISLESRKQLQGQVVEEMLTLNRGKAVLVDGHIMVDSESGFVPGIQFDMIEKCSFDAIIVVRGEVEDIIRQRQRNTTRYMHSISTEDHIKIYQELVSSSALLFSMQGYLSLHFVNNKYDEIENSVNQVLEIANQILQRNW